MPTLLRYSTSSSRLSSPPGVGSLACSRPLPLVELLMADLTADERIDLFLDGFEDRLARAMQKALDVVTADADARLRSLEEDQARILRHLGLAGEQKVNPDREL